MMTTGNRLWLPNRLEAGLELANRVEVGIEVAQQGCYQDRGWQVGLALGGSVLDLGWSQGQPTDLSTLSMRHQSLAMPPTASKVKNQKAM